MHDIMNDRVKGYDEPPKPEEKKRVEHDKPAFDDLKVVGTLGKGSFGHVQFHRASV